MEIRTTVMGKKFKFQKKLQIKFNFEHQGQKGQKVFAHNSRRSNSFHKRKERSSIISEKNTVIIFKNTNVTECQVANSFEIIVENYEEITLL